MSNELMNETWGLIIYTNLLTWACTALYFWLGNITDKVTKPLKGEK
jgi:hypothetical protein